MEHWLSHKNGRVIEQVLCEDGEKPRWSDDSKRATKVQVARHGCLLTETFDVETALWEPSVAYAAQRVEAECLRLLQESDYPPLFERPEEVQPAWRQYRQELRDYRKKCTDPFNPVYPQKPV